eukprot:Plantae.Rhodophyta-Hildenbrandia_rubra.ctg19418.p1 GENE.Plantae.Rhodophyta-Hildenbrandia_rubra.ctg19418~~Plantae.Rhodophyta-Hildenbrandia_rubra.ctg19418.p1  ORF type:complete len:328 (-),score=54.51 Plantae.Rhodophyta-Hildenbrandia_rubra.ctg19418:104-1087(-)
MLHTRTSGACVDFNNLREFLREKESDPDERKLAEPEKSDRSDYALIDEDLRAVIDKRKRNNEENENESCEAGDFVSNRKKKQRLKKVRLSKRVARGLQTMRSEARKREQEKLLSAFEKARIQSAGEMPVKPLIALGGALSESPASILKDDGCNANAASKSFFEKRKDLFDSIRDSGAAARHSGQNVEERGAVVLNDARVKIGDHARKSNFVAADCRCDALLGRPWHVENKPAAIYQKRAATIGSIALRASENAASAGEIQSISAKKFKKLHRKGKGVAFCLKINAIEVSDECKDGRKNTPDAELAAISVGIASRAPSQARCRARDHN